MHRSDFLEAMEIKDPKALSDYRQERVFWAVEGRELELYLDDADEIVYVCFAGGYPKSLMDFQHDLRMGGHLQKYSNAIYSLLKKE